MKLTKNQQYLIGGAVVLGIILYVRGRKEEEVTSSASGDCGCGAINCQGSCEKCCKNVARIKSASSRGWGRSRRQSRNTMASRGWSTQAKAGVRNTSCQSVGLGGNLTECEKQCDNAGGEYDNGYCNNHMGTFGGGRPTRLIRR
jgi:hypothetical protein